MKPWKPRKWGIYYAKTAFSILERGVDNRRSRLRLSPPPDSPCIHAGFSVPIPSVPLWQCNEKEKAWAEGGKQLDIIHVVRQVFIIK